MQACLFDYLYEKYKIDKPIRLIELFAGYGSQAMALELLGVPFDHHFVCEFDKYAIDTYNAFHNTNFETSNVTKITAKDLNITETNKYDYILTYSFPCTDLSLAGKRAGMEKGSGTRSGLLWEVERLLKETKELPQILLMENVPQVLSANGWQEWCEFLESLGYKNYCQVLNAKDFYIPQNRKRAFMVSILGEYTYNFPEKMELQHFLKDYLEEKVDEKYYLSDKMIKYIIANNDKWTGNNEKSLINKSIATTINTNEGSRRCDASNYICEELPTDYDLKKIKVVGSLKGAGLPWDKMHNQTCLVYDADGLCPTLDTMQGGHRQPKIIVEEEAVIIPENTKKGYAIASEGDGVYINRPHQKRGCGQKGIIQTLKTSGNDVGVVVKVGNYSPSGHNVAS